MNHIPNSIIPFTEVPISRVHIVFPNSLLLSYFRISTPKSHTLPRNELPHEMNRLECQFPGPMVLLVLTCPLVSLIVSHTSNLVIKVSLLFPTHVIHNVSSHAISLPKKSSCPVFLLSSKPILCSSCLKPLLTISATLISIL